MSTRLTTELGLSLGAAIFGVVGAALIEPAVISVGVVAAGTAAVMRFQDQRSALAAAKRMAEATPAASQN